MSQPAGGRQLAEAPAFRAPVPRMHHWPTPSASTTNDDNSKPTSDSEWEPNIYTTPTARRHIPNFTRAKTPVGHQLDPRFAA